MDMMYLASTNLGPFTVEFFFNKETETYVIQYPEAFSVVFNSVQKISKTKNNNTYYDEPDYTGVRSGKITVTKTFDNITISDWFHYFFNSKPNAHYNPKDFILRVNGQKTTAYHHLSEGDVITYIRTNLPEYIEDNIKTTSSAAKE